MRWSSQ